MIHDHQIYTRLKQLFKDSPVMNDLAIQRVEMADYPEVPGPSDDEGGIKNFLPAILITKGDNKNGWLDEGNEDTIKQQYFVKVKYARIFSNTDNPHIIMPVAIAKIMNALKNCYDLNSMDLNNTAMPQRMEFWGDWDCMEEPMMSGTTFIGIGYFQIKITLNQQL